MNMQHKGKFTGVRLSGDLSLFGSNRGGQEKVILIDHLACARLRIGGDEGLDAPWFCLQVKSGCEYRVESRLRDCGIEASVPSEKFAFVKNGRIIEDQNRPFFRGYVLVRCMYSVEAMMGLRNVIDVVSIVGGARYPWRVPGKFVQRFNAMIEDGSLDRLPADRSITAGDRVKIKCGPFEGFDARVLQVTKARKARCTVAIRLYGRETEIEMPLAHVDKL
ncbi:transcription termination/antitermination protein NusG [Rhizobium sp. PL01]|uniref:transcription termination/antitermination protein NusG n=1 Tax=Rhizobium sp. PL01 TaxID=3085631 RepID=UPI002981E0CC|nr:transcription termination/antitermination protein NusG [Rhizobium sp. PL01]MDW5315004.1 transcription termination/antitermination protein NusG [Rhizobium sp. PL01]